MRKNYFFSFFVVVALVVGLWFVCAIYVFPDKRPEWISAFAAVISVAGVFLVRVQLASTKNIAQDQFEDTLEKEYRDLAARIPTDALIGGELSPRQYKAASDELFRYFDFNNKQVMLRKQGRIGDSTWENWLSGIKFNLSLPAFKMAWSEVKRKTESQKSEFFSELRMLEEENFQCDPKIWK